MNGSEKQIKWATEIKAGFEAAIKDIDEKKFWELVEKDDPVDIEDFSFGLFQKVVAHIMSCEEARDWIDNFKYVNFDEKFLSMFCGEVELYSDDEDWITLEQMWFVKKG